MFLSKAIEGNRRLRVRVQVRFVHFVFILNLPSLTRDIR